MNIWQYTILTPGAGGGVERHVEGVSRELEKLGHMVHIGANPPDFPPEAPQIVHTHGDAWPNRKLIREIRRRKGAKWVQVFHGTSLGRVAACREFFSLSGWRGSLRDFSLAQMADAGIANSRQTLFEAQRYFFFKGPTTVIPNGIDPVEFSPLEKISPLPRLAFVGRGKDRVKNAQGLIEACRLVHERHPDFELWMFPGVTPKGGTPTFLKNQGPIHGEMMVSRLKTCRAMILCSFYEGDGIVLREAQAMGMPIIASDLPSLRENAAEYPGATFIDPRSAKSMAKAIESVIFNPNLRTLEPRIRTWSNVAAEFEQFYKILFKGSA